MTRREIVIGAYKIAKMLIGYDKKKRVGLFLVF
jgi:hypothetical protein